MTAVGWEYLRTKALTLEDGGQNLLEQQKGFQMINPTDEWFPGKRETNENLQKFWSYAKLSLRRSNEDDTVTNRRIIVI